MNEKDDLKELQEIFKAHSLETRYIEETEDIQIPSLCVLLNDEEEEEGVAFSIHVLPMMKEEFKVLGMIQIYAEIETKDVKISKEDTNYLMNKMNTLVPLGQFIHTEDNMEHANIALRYMFTYRKEEPLDGELLMEELMLLKFGVDYLETVYHMINENDSIDVAIEKIEQILKD